MSFRLTAGRSTYWAKEPLLFYEREPLNQMYFWICPFFTHKGVVCIALQTFINLNTEATHFTVGWASYFNQPGEGHPFTAWTSCQLFFTWSLIGLLQWRRKDNISQTNENALAIYLKEAVLV